MRKADIDESGLDWCVYWLQDAAPGDTLPFYVGCTNNPIRRLAEHCGQPYSPAYARCREILAAGRRPVISILARHALPEFAKAQERALLAEFGDQLTNRLIPAQTISS